MYEQHRRCDIRHSITTVVGSYNFAVRITDSEGRIATKRLSITINPNKPVITTEVLHYGQATVAYSATVTATRGGSTYNWCKDGGAYPTGFTAPPNPPSCPATITGTPSITISGTPSAAGTYSFTLKVTDNRGRQASKNLSIAINPP